MDCPYTPVEITNVVNRMPNSFGQISKLNLFSFEGIAGTTFGIEESDGDACNTIIPTAAYCCDYEPNANKTPGRKWRYLDVPHTPLFDTVRACDVSGQRAYGLTGLDNRMMSVEEEVIRRQRDMRQKLEMTLEFRYLSALKGVIKDADGSVILDLFQHFGITQSVVDFHLSDDAFDVLQASRRLWRTMRDNVRQMGYSGIVVYVDSLFFDALVSHPSAIDIWKRCCEMSARTMDASNGANFDFVPRFDFGGISWREYNEEACTPAAINDPAQATGAVEFLAPSTGVAFPVGVTGQRLYELVGAPRQTLDEVNTKATQIFYADIRANERNDAIALSLETNTLPIVKQPAALIKVTMS
ncbi:MAG: major capsid protein [Polynucleobacter sp.]